MLFMRSPKAKDYEICKRKTKCEQCGSVMRKGDKRSRTYERRGRWIKYVYKCNVCDPERRPVEGKEKFLKQLIEVETRIREEVKSWTVIEPSAVRFGRMLRPILIKKGD